MSIEKVGQSAVKTVRAAAEKAASEKPPAARTEAKSVAKSSTSPQDGEPGVAKAPADNASLSKLAERIEGYEPGATEHGINIADDGRDEMSSRVPGESTALGRPPGVPGKFRVPGGTVHG